MTKTTQSIDLSVILTAHDETLVCGPTMASADAAIAHARAAGFTVEPIIVLDNATPECAEWFGQDVFDHWQRIDLAEGDLGRARNAAVTRSKGAFIAFLDADDLISENWLSGAATLLAQARDRGDRLIAHPELNWLFDGARSVYHKPDQDDRLFTPWYFYAMNYYDSMCMCPREVHETIPYASRDIPNGLSFQDWQFSVETMHAGWRHASARDTVIFKRRRDNSLVTESRARQAVVRALDGMAIDEIAALGAPHNRKAVPAETLRVPLAQTPQPGLAARLKSWVARRSGRVPATPQPAPRATHAGAALAHRAAHVRHRSRPSRAWLRPDYTRVSEVFDLDYYLSANPDLLQHDTMDPVSHYLRAGVHEGRRALPYFGAKYYQARYPEVGKDPSKALDHYLRHGRAKGYVAAPFEHFETMAGILELSPREAEALLHARYDDLRARLETGTLGKMVNRAAVFEPLISAVWPEALALKIPPFHSDLVVKRVAAMQALCGVAGGRRARAVICVNRARWGGARRMEGHIAHALAQGIGADEIVVLSTDAPGKLPAGRLPKGVRHVDFADLVALKGDERARVLVQFLRALRPETVFNVNSRLLWDALAPYGRALAASFRIVGCLFCNERTVLGHAAGYPLTRVYRHFDVLAAIATDSHALADEIKARHVIPDAWAHRIAVLRAPVDASIPVAAAPGPLAGRRPQVFWSGRFDAQKRVDIAYAVARARPDIDFRMWGGAVMGAGHVLPDKPDNVTHEGTYAHFSDLPLDQADLWLYTAAWDGVPSILLEVAMTGLPLVGTLVGGTGEVLRDGLAEAVPEDADPDAYLAAIDRVLADPDAARARARDLRDILIADRTEDAYGEMVAALMQGDPHDPAA